MAIDLFSMLLSGAVSWGIGRCLDVLVGCSRCGEKYSESVGNVQENYLGCPNCHKEVQQFTNACDFTVSSDGDIGHVKAVFRGGWEVNYDPSDRGFLRTNYEGWLFFHAAMKSIAMAGKQFVLSGELSDYNNGYVYTRDDILYTPSYYTSVWDSSRLPLKWKDVPDEDRDGRIFAVDLRVKSRYGDVLCEDRLLAQLWK